MQPNVWVLKIRRSHKRYLKLFIPGDKVQIDVKEVPYNCLKGNVLRYRKLLYQYTAIDECIRMSFVYGFDERTSENLVNFLTMLIKVFRLKIEKIQIDNSTEFTYKFIIDNVINPFNKSLSKLGIKHKLIYQEHHGIIEMLNEATGITNNIFMIEKYSEA